MPEILESGKSYHLVVSVAGLEARLNASRPNAKHGLWNVLVGDNGVPLTYGEHFAEVERCKKLGYEVIPTCNHHDKKGHCLGHTKK